MLISKTPATFGCRDGCLTNELAFAYIPIYMGYVGMSGRMITGLMSRIERKYCLISTSYLTGLFEIFILLHI